MTTETIPADSAEDLQAVGGELIDGAIDMIVEKVPAITQHSPTVVGLMAGLSIGFAIQRMRDNGMADEAIAKLLRKPLNG